MLKFPRNRDENPALEKDEACVNSKASTDALLKPEAEKVWQLHQSGVTWELYFRQDRRDAVLALEFTNVEEARAVLDTHPLVQAHLIDFEIVPLIPYDGFSRLFTKQP